MGKRGNLLAAATNKSYSLGFKTLTGGEKKSSMCLRDTKIHNTDRIHFPFWKSFLFGVFKRCEFQSTMLSKPHRCVTEPCRSVTVRTEEIQSSAVIFTLHLTKALLQRWHGVKEKHEVIIMRSLWKVLIDKRVPLVTSPFYYRWAVRCRRLCLRDKYPNFTFPKLFQSFRKCRAPFFF